MPDYKEIVKRKIVKNINRNAVADYIFQEIEECFQHINPFKLDNILENAEIFIQFVYELDKHNTELYMGKAQRMNMREDKETLIDRDGNPYISEYGWNSLSNQERKDFHTISQKEITQRTTVIKGWFLLSMTDFAQGGQCRVKNKYEYKLDSEYKIQ